jgi:predicted nucleic acid-binding protein
VSRTYLVDKSALARSALEPVATRFEALLTGDGVVATCPIIDLEVLYSARSTADYEATRQEQFGVVSYPLSAEAGARALDVQRLLAARGQHRLSIPDLLIAAIAELNDLVVLHYDADYDRIADVTGQPVEWVVERGSV